MNGIHIGATIARLRKQHELTQEALAEKLGVTKSAVSKWELEQSVPDVILLPYIAAYFGITLDELFGWSQQLDPKEINELSARISALFQTDPAAAYLLLKQTTAEHASCWPWVLQAAGLYSMRAALDEDRRDESIRATFDLLDRMDDRCHDANLLRQARLLRASTLTTWSDDLSEAIALAESLVDPPFRRCLEPALHALRANGSARAGRKSTGAGTLCPCGRHLEYLGTRTASRG